MRDLDDSRVFRGSGFIRKTEVMKFRIAHFGEMAVDAVADW